MYQVEKFVYNGFMVSPPKGGWGQIANYTATFKQWTNDPGIAIFKCSDGVDRKIPTCCLIGDDKLPEQPKKDIIIFGEPSKS